MKAIYFSRLKIAGQAVVLLFPIHSKVDSGGSGTWAEIKTMSQRIRPGRAEQGANKHSASSSIILNVSAGFSLYVHTGSEDAQHCAMK